MLWRALTWRPTTSTRSVRLVSHRRCRKAELTFLVPDLPPPQHSPSFFCYTHRHDGGMHSQWSADRHRCDWRRTELVSLPLSLSLAPLPLNSSPSFLPASPPVRPAAAPFSTTTLSRLALASMPLAEVSLPCFSLRRGSRFGGALSLLSLVPSALWLCIPSPELSTDELTFSFSRSWERSAIPADIKRATPRWKTWGTPVAAWDGATCDIRKYFKYQTLTFVRRRSSLPLHPFPLSSRADPFSDPQNIE